MIRKLLTERKNLKSIAVIENNQEVRYIDLINKARYLCRFLPHGQQGSVAILLPNGGDYIAAFWGTAMSGLTAFPLNVLMTGHEILPLLKQASVNTVITSTEYKRVFEKAPGFKALKVKIILIDKIKPDTTGWECFAADIGTDEQMMLLNTSGTTGKAKIVRLSERNVEAAVLGYLDKLCFKETDLKNTRYILAVPFSSVYGMMIISACLKLSVPIIVLDNAFTLDALYKAAEKHKATHYEGSATAITLMEQMAGRTVPYDISTLKYFGFGGSKVSGRTIEKLLKAYPDKEFYQGYGMTEAAPLIAKHPHIKLEKTDSVGTAITGMEIAVKANKITKTPFIKGEIVVRGLNVMLGYLKNKTETNRVLKNGYLYTGDIGYLDDEGYLYICGRKKNIIIVRGFNVYPEEVEECIQSSLLVKDCFVYGQTDAYGNEAVFADIVPAHPDISEKEIRMFCDAHLAEYKRPHKIIFKKSIQKNAAGKTERRINRN